MSLEGGDSHREIVENLFVSREHCLCREISHLVEGFQVVFEGVSFEVDMMAYVGGDLGEDMVPREEDLLLRVVEAEVLPGVPRGSEGFQRMAAAAEAFSVC